MSAEHKHSTNPTVLAPGYWCRKSIYSKICINAFFSYLYHALYQAGQEVILGLFVPWPASVLVWIVSIASDSSTKQYVEFAACLCVFLVCLMI